MSRPTPPTYKTKNWTAYNEALKRRGSLTIWLDPEMSWDAVPSGKRGRQQTYSDTAIQTCLTMKVLFGMVAMGAPLMEWMAPVSGIAMCHVGCCEHGQRREPSMSDITTIGIDLAKSVFQLHGVDAEGRSLLRRQLRRSQMLEFFQRQPACLIGMEACASAHYWARELIKLGHDVRLMQPSYVKGYVKRGKTDKADAEAICEAVSRPSMRFVPLKSEDTQALLMTHKAREFLVRQQTQIVNAMRAHLGEFGVVIPKGSHNVERLIMACDRADLPAPAHKALNLLADQLVDTQKRSRN